MTQTIEDFQSVNLLDNFYELNIEQLTTGKRVLAFTVKDNRIGKCPEYSEYWNLLLYRKCQVIHMIPEHDSKGIVHYHGIVVVPKNTFLKKLIVKGMHVKYVDINNIEGWIKYTLKSQKPKEKTKDIDLDELPENEKAEIEWNFSKMRLEEALEKYNPDNFVVPKYSLFK